MTLTTVLVMIDGFDPEYVESSPMSNLRQLAKQGFITEAKAMMPTVTNVNTVSLVTASYPEAHGITSNYWLNREDGKEYYMESGEFILAESMFQRATKQGARSLLVTAKDQLRKLLVEGTTLSVSSEQPLQWVVDGCGEGRYAFGGRKIKMNSCRLDGLISEVDPLRDLPGRDSRGPAAVIIADDHRLNTYPQRCRLGRARILR